VRLEDDASIPAANESRFPWPPAEGESALTALFESWRGAVFRPTEFFRNLPRNGGYGPFILYYLVIGVLVAGASLFWSTLGPAGLGQDTADQLGNASAFGVVAAGDIGRNLTRVTAQDTEQWQPRPLANEVPQGDVDGCEGDFELLAADAPHLPGGAPGVGDGEEFLPEIFRSERVFTDQQRLQLALDELGGG
jgi:hypothetical protein